MLGDFTGKSSGLDPDTGYVRWSSSSGLESISNTKVVDDMVPGSSGIKLKLAKALAKAL